MLAPPIFPGRRQPSIVGRNELNYRVRNGNGWTLALIGTNFVGANCTTLTPGSAGSSRRFAAPPLQLGFASLDSELALSERRPLLLLCYPDIPENKLYYRIFNALCQDLFCRHRCATGRTDVFLVHLHGLEPGTH